MAVRPRHHRATPKWSSRTRMRGAAAATSVLLVAGSGLMMPAVAQAAPAADPATSIFTALGAFAGVVPDGVCSVRATVLGGAGGSAMSTTAVSPNGGGARVSASYDVLAGQAFSGVVGGGGQQPSTNSQPGGVGGANGGGAGGSSGDVNGTRHAGAGGGGFSQLTLGSDLAVLAGGGGGSAGGHSETTEGVGGNAGLPAAAGVADGAAGTVGRDFPTATVVTGGAGGSTVGGAGGSNSALSAADGTAGSSLQGGAGGADTNPDAGGGGGAGFFGGGGGASTVAYNTQSSGAVEISGAGGGGGSSFVAASVDLGPATAAVSDVASTVGSRIAAGSRGAGAAGSVALDWQPCAYDLAVAKTVSSATAPVGSTLGWTVTVENLGPDDMTRGDTVTIADSLPGAGATTITGIAVTGPSSTYFADAAMTCNAEVGDAMPASLDCSRDYQVRGGAVSGARGLNVGEKLTVSYTQKVADAAGAVLENTATVTDRADGDSNDTASATSTVLARPTATDDSDLGNAIGETVSVSVLGNDTGTLVPGSVVLVDQSGNPVVGPYVVPGEGTWTVSGGIVTFAPAPGFATDPKPVTYRVTDTNGLTDDATVTVSYLPKAADDTSHGNRGGSAVTVDVVGNDTGVFDPTSVRLVDPATGQLVTAMTVERQGRWSVDAATGAITFTPVAGFTGDPTPAQYRITDVAGNSVTALVTITYVYPAAPAGLLAFTGADTALPLAGGGLLLLAGLGLVAAAAVRRRARG